MLLRRLGVTLLALGGAVFAPHAARAIQMSGTVSYTGQHGPVSSSRPILLAISTPAQELAKAQLVPVTTSPGAFALPVPAAGDYIIGMVLDVMPDGSANIGEPFQIYDHQFNPASATVLHVPAAGITELTLTFDDTGILSGIGGTVAYTGNKAGTAPGSNIRIVLASDPNFSMIVGGPGAKGNPGRFDVVTFDTKTYYLAAFFDVNGNKSLDTGEPFTIYNDKGTMPGDPIVAGPTQNALDVTFGDQNLWGLVPTPTVAPPTPTPTPTQMTAVCTGDCNDDRSVTVDELLTLVNIALGNAGIGTCTAGDANHDGQITIDEILTAVNNALNGCG